MLLLSWDFNTFIFCNFALFHSPHFKSRCWSLCAGTCPGTNPKAELFLRLAPVRSTAGKAIFEEMAAVETLHQKLRGELYPVNLLFCSARCCLMLRCNFWAVLRCAPLWAPIQCIALHSEVHFFVRPVPKLSCFCALLEMKLAAGEANAVDR